MPALAGAGPDEVPTTSGASAAAGIPAVAMGVLILWRRPGNLVGRLQALAALAAVVLGAMDAYSQADGHHGLPISHVAVALTQGSRMLYYLPWAWLMLVFPTGRLRTRFDRGLAISLPATVVLFNFLAAVAPADYMAPWARAPHVFGTLPGSDIAGACCCRCSFFNCWPACGPSPGAFAVPPPPRGRSFGGWPPPVLPFRRHFCSVGSVTGRAQVQTW